MRSGVKLESETIGSGLVANRGTTVTVRYRLTLNRGDVVQEDQTATFTLGKREVIAGLEYAVEGMLAGGRRRVHVSPHLAYRDRGVPNVIPPDAVLVFDIELLDVHS